MDMGRWGEVWGGGEVGRWGEFNSKFSPSPHYPIPPSFNYLPEAILNPSAMGPKAKTGKKVSTPKIKITPAVTLVNSRVSVLRVPGVAGTVCLRVMLSANSRMAIMGT
jgi:hypothetical protein